MSARTSWSVRSGRQIGASAEGRSERNDDLPLDDILDARFDDEGRLAGIGRGTRQRVAERLEPRPPTMSAEELERAVQKLARGLEEMERQSAARRSRAANLERRADPELGQWPDRQAIAMAPARQSESVEPPAQPASAGPRHSPPLPVPQTPPGEAEARSFVTGPLDRLEAMLDSLSKRLEEREAKVAVPAARKTEDSIEPAPESSISLAEALAEVEPEAAPAEKRGAGRDRRTSADRRRADRRAQADRQQPIAAAQATRPLEDLAAAGAFRPADELAKSRRETISDQLESPELAAEHQSPAGAASPAETPHMAAPALIAAGSDAADSAGPAPATAAEPDVYQPTTDHQTPAALLRLVGDLETRIAGLQGLAEENRIEPVRQELLALLRQMEELGREGRSVSGTVGEIHSRIGELETSVKAARNMTGNRLAELQDRIADLTNRLGDSDEEPPVFGEMRTGQKELRRHQAEILGRIGRMEGMVGRFVSPEDLWQRVDGLREQLKEMPSHTEIVRIEEQLLVLAERMDILPVALSDGGANGRIEAQLQSVASDVTDLRRLRHVGAAELEARLTDLADRLEQIRDAAAEPDLSRFEAKLSALATGIEEGRRASADAIARLDAHLAELADAVAREEENASEQAILALREKMDAMAASLAAQDAGGARNLQHLNAKFDSLQDALSEQKELLSRPQLAPLETRLEAMQAAFDDLKQQSDAAASRLEPVTELLVDISQRLGAMAEVAGPGPLADRFAALEQGLASLHTRADGRALSTQLEGIVRKLDWLNGKTTDPARMAESFARLEAVVRTEAAGRSFERLEKKLDAADPMRLKGHLDVLRDEIRAGRSDERFMRLEKKIEAADPMRLADYFEALREEIRAAGPNDRLARLEKKLEALDPATLAEHFEALRAEIRTAGSDQRFASLEEKLGSVGPDWFAERFDALRAEIRGAGADRLASIESKLDESDPALLTDHLEILRDEIRTANPDERLARLETKLDAAGPERIVSLLERLEASAREADEERFARLEERIETLGRNLAGSADAMQQDDFAELRSDIVALRRELRAIPASGEGDQSLSVLLRSVAERLDDAQRQPTVTSRDLDDQVERIARLLEGPQKTQAALPQIEASLRAIEARLNDPAARLPLAAETEVGAAEDGAEAVAEVARALSGELDTLRNAAQTSDRKTRESLEAVQDTLEAVVKRMAFLERENELEFASTGLRAPEQPVVDAPVQSSLPALLRQAEPETEALVAPQVSSTEDELVTVKADPAQTGLLGRFTSSQLLRRATGGRTESFSPDTEDSELEDLPLEPGTDSPLSSALAGAPSVDSAVMSGSRPRGNRPEAAFASTSSLDEGGASRARRSADALAGDDFLIAARRAAQAASQEQAEAERVIEENQGSGLSRLFSAFGGRRRAVLAGALALAVALAAVQVIRTEIGETETAGRTLSLPPARSASTDAAPPVEGEEAIAFAAPELAAEPLKPREDGAPLAEAAPVAPVLPDPSATASTGNPAIQPPPPAAALPAQPAPPLVAAAPAMPPALPAGIGPDELRQAALTGNPAAQFEVATRFADGRGVPQDPVASVEWYERAAAGGLPVAQYRLGSIYENGMGVPKDLAKAQEWYRRGADAGNIKSMHNLAVLYAEGAGGEPNLNAAVGLFRRAAEYGVRDSQFNIAVLHARGLGVPQDMIEAYKWFAVAAELGDAEATKRRDAIGATLNPADLAKAKAAAEAFEPMIADPASNEVPAGSWGPTTTSSISPRSGADLTARVQEMLSERGLLAGPADGVAGKQTRDAVLEFQKGAGLPATGEIDQRLLHALEGSST